MKKMIVAFAAVAAMTMTAGVAEAGSRGKSGGKQTSVVSQSGQFSSGGLLNLSPNVSVGGILNNSAILSGNGIGILGTGILTNTLTTITKNSGNNYNSHNKSGSKSRGRY